jgi:hypothetical protein
VPNPDLALGVDVVVGWFGNWFGSRNGFLKLDRHENNTSCEDKGPAAIEAIPLRCAAAFNVFYTRAHPGIFLLFNQDVVA